MRFLKKLICLTVVVFVISCMLSGIYIFRPDIMDSIEIFLDPEQKDVETITGNHSLQEETTSHSGESVEREETEQESEEYETGEKEPLENDVIGESVVSDYILPKQSEIVVPENVSGRNGYQQIQENREQIDDEAAEELQNQIDTGYTGDGLDFDGVRYPYYAMLDDRGKHIYRQIYANTNERYAAFMPVEPITLGQLKNVFLAVYNDHPELFWLETAYSCKYLRDGRCVEIDLKFNRTAQNMDDARAVFQENASQIISEAQNLSSDYEKEKFVHDKLTERVSYDLGAEMNQSAYSALVNGSTVCAGYARAFQYLLQQLGIPCYYCTGYAGEAHAWNIVALDDGYYNVDVTWDDSDGGRYDYFNKTDTDYADSHIRQELSVYLPPCNGSVYRNLERNPEDNSLRSIADFGMAEDQVLTDMDSYYRDCYDQILQNGKGSYTFYNVIENEQLLEEWHQAYEAERYKQAYMENAMIQLGISSCEMKMEIEELRDGKFLITHKVFAW
ncbi:transglutaminase domain-containing protein [Candidatus Ventrimonas sp. KK005]